MNKYKRAIRVRDAEVGPHTHHIDVYDVLVAYGVTCPAVQHAVKKLLCAGTRGHKDRTEDLEEAIAAIERAVELTHVGTPEASP